MKARFSVALMPSRRCRPAGHGMFVSMLIFIKCFFDVFGVESNRKQDVLNQLNRLRHFGVIFVLVALFRLHSCNYKVCFNGYFHKLNPAGLPDRGLPLVGCNEGIQKSLNLASMSRLAVAKTVSDQPGND